MKKLLTVAAMLLLAVPVFADNPVAQGNFVISMPIISWDSASGDLYENAAGDKRTVLSLNVGDYDPGLQYFVIESLAVGGVLGYSQWERGDVTITTTRFGPMASYYFNAGVMLPYASLAWVWTKTENDNGVVTTDETDTNLIIAVGLTYMLGKNLGLYGEFSYSMDENEDDAGVTTDGKEMSINVGFKAFF